MHRLILLIIIITSLTVFAQTEKLGKEITLKEKTSISKILDAPEEFVGKDVLVEGEILDVCSKAGCWMELKSDAENQRIKIKVKDGDIVFPIEAKGKTAIVEGTVYKIDLTKEEALNYYEHVAEEQGVAFDPSTVTGPVTIYQIKGLGAEIN